MTQREHREGPLANLSLPESRRPIRVAMLSYSFYDVDARVARYAETLAAIGNHVDVVSLRRDGQEPYDRVNGVNVFKIQKRERNEKLKLSYLFRLLKFFIKSSVFIGRRHAGKPYDLIHVHSVPDFEVFAALLPKLFGAKIILDIHDIVPEFYASKFDCRPDSMIFKALLLLEKLSANFADHVIISNHVWEKRLTSRSVKSERCSTILNYPDPSLFYLRARENRHEKTVLIYPGSLNWHQGLDIAIRAFHSIKDQVPEAEFHIYGTGGQTDYLAALVEDLGLRDKVVIRPFLPLDQIAGVMANADIGVVPKRNDPFGGEAFSTKILEFMSLGVPVVISRTKIDAYYFNDSVVKFFTPEDVNDLAESMLRMIKDRSFRETLAENALRFVADYSWARRKHEYLEVVYRLTGHHTGNSAQGSEIRDA